MGMINFFYSYVLNIGEGKCLRRCSRCAILKIQALGSGHPSNRMQRHEHGSGSATRNGNLYKPARRALNHRGRLVELRSATKKQAGTNTEIATGDRTRPQGLSTLPKGEGPRNRPFALPNRTQHNVLYVVVLRDLNSGTYWTVFTVQLWKSSLM
jgi:hypothetical protein